MVAGCPKCSARYRVDPDRIGPDGAKLRCTKCSAVFLVRAAKAEAPPPDPQPAEPTPEPEPEFDSARLVVIADPDEARGKVTAEAVRSWGLTTCVVHDGVEAMLTIQRTLPAAIVLDVALPKMFGFQVCEIVKRNESLRDTTVILVGAIHHQDRYRRDPAELYGADVYIENPDLPDGLRVLLRDAGLDVSDLESGGTESPAAAAPRTAQAGPVLPDPIVESNAATHRSFPTPTPDATASGQPPVVPTAELTQPAPIVVAESAAPVAEEVPPAPSPSVMDEDPERSAERERAQRLARIAVSEMVLYQPEKFDQASRDGVLEQALDLEIQEARALLRQRISEEVRAETDFIIDELHRVAKERGEHP